MLSSLEVEDFFFNLWRLLLKGTIYHKADKEQPAPWQLELRAIYHHPTQAVQKMVKLTLVLHALAATMYALNDRDLDGASATSHLSN